MRVFWAKEPRALLVTKYAAIAFKGHYASQQQPSNITRNKNKERMQATILFTLPQAAWLHGIDLQGLVVSANNLSTFRETGSGRSDSHIAHGRSTAQKICLYTSHHKSFVGCLSIIVHACTVILLHAYTMIIVHVYTMITVHVSCPTGLMFNDIKDGEFGGRSPSRKQVVFAGRRPPNCVARQKNSTGFVRCVKRLNRKFWRFRWTRWSRLS